MIELRVKGVEAPGRITSCRNCMGPPLRCSGVSFGNLTDAKAYAKKHSGIKKKGRKYSIVHDFEPVKIYYVTGKVRYVMYYRIYKWETSFAESFPKDRLGDGKS